MSGDSRELTELPADPPTMVLDLHLVGGCESSGSTVLAHVLDGLHDLRSGPPLSVCHRPELYHAADFPRRLYGALTGRSTRYAATVDGVELELVPSAFLTAREWHGLDGLDAEFELLSCASLAELVSRVRERMARRQGLGTDFTWIERTPANAGCALEFLQAFPESRFVHIVRDGRDVVASLARRYARELSRERADTHLVLALARWTRDVSRARRARHEPGWLEVRYEELCVEPLTTVNRILEHLGRLEVGPTELALRLSPAAERDPELMRGGARPTWTLEPDRPPSPAAIGRWRRELPPEFLALAERFRFAPPGEERTPAFGELLDELGYR